MSRAVMPTFAGRLSPSFPRDLCLTIEEAELVRRALKQQGISTGTMVDVGAHRGTVTRLFAPRGWQVHAFEPDPVNRMRFRSVFDASAAVRLNSNAVGLVDGEKLQFYSSEVSTGISSIVPFHESHVPVCEVTTVRLETYLDAVGVDHLEFLKVDTEGFDLFVLQSFGWNTMAPPDVVLCEYEDNKTVNVGYTTTDLARFLVDHGYSVLVSEWHPITSYGVQHSWRRLVRWRDDLELDGDSWGNLLAFQDPAVERSAVNLLPGLLSARERRPRGGYLCFEAWRRGLLLRHGRQLLAEELENNR